jgi:toxin ParE1/3/4
MGARRRRDAGRALCHSFAPEGIRLLAQRPELGQMRRDLIDLPLRFWPVFSYLIVYDPARRPIEIVAVLHGARDLSRILSERT